MFRPTSSYFPSDPLAVVGPTFSYFPSDSLAVFVPLLGLRSLTFRQTLIVMLVVTVTRLMIMMMMMRMIMMTVMTMMTMIRMMAMPHTNPAHHTHPNKQATNQPINNGDDSKDHVDSATAADGGGNDMYDSDGVDDSVDDN